jgi:DNA-3-methyladenine glycosylase I
MTKADVKRCAWPKSDLAIRYHDEEWGVAVHDDRTFFEFLILEGAQAGLSWETVLRKRESYRSAFAEFDPAKASVFKKSDIARWMKDEGLIRNRLKLESVIQNAQAFLRIQKEFGSFDAYVWRFVNGKPLVAQRKMMKDIPAKTAESDALSKDLKKRGFNFVGSTICYAFMQATGLVDDHTDDCFCAARRRRSK